MSELSSICFSAPIESGVLADQQSIEKFIGGIMATSRVVPMKVTQMKAAQVSRPGADFEIVEREIAEPGPGHVRIKVQACGLCHSDVLTKDGLWPGIE